MSFLVPGLVLGMTFGGVFIIVPIWERHMERGAAREQRRMKAARGRLYDWERDEYGWPS